jgi:hypothetical protein
MRIIEQLRAERDCIEQAIQSLERLQSRNRRKRGRPPKWHAEAGSGARARALEFSGD